MKFASGLLELIIIMTATLLISLGALVKRGVKQGLQERKQMSAIGFMLLTSWILLIGIPKFIREIRENGELARFKKNSLANGDEPQSENYRFSRNNHKHRKKSYNKTIH